MATSSASLSSLISRISVTNPGFDQERVMHAFERAQEIYDDEPHRTGAGLLEHAMGVLELLSPFEPDEDAIIACLLHHAFFHRGITLAELEEQFGATVRSLVSGVHLLSNVNLDGRRNSIDDLRLMLLSVSDDPRIILISLCDRCHLLDVENGMPEDERKKIAADVLQLYAPVAARLGIYSLKHELERRAFPLCYPSDAERIMEQLAQLQAQTGSFLEETARDLREQFAKKGLAVDVKGRKKEPYSIFRKMNAKSLTYIEDVFDLFALRAIVDTTEDCYQVLGFLHKIGRPFANRFKDYIAFPKPNGYQSLHTTLAQLPQVPQDTFVEVQVRTRRMHREAQFGIAAHWSYKEYGATRLAMEHIQLRKMLATQESVEADEDRQEFADHIFVLTPKGAVVELPEGATPLDFAFQVHTDVGLSFRSARVNGSIVPLDHELENGDIVEIIKFRTPQPSPQWMQLLKMSSSRSKLKRYLYAQRRTEFVARGRELLNMELAKHALSPLDSDLSVLRMYEGEVLPFARREDLLMKIGQESEKASALLSHLDALRGHNFIKADSPVRTAPRQQRKDSLIALEGGLPMPIRYAKCCKPDDRKKKEEIVGVINRTGEVVVHRKTCGMLRNVNPERKIGAKWRAKIRV